jgi:hypothetical protein
MHKLLCQSKRKTIWDNLFLGKVAEGLVVPSYMLIPGKFLQEVLQVGIIFPIEYLQQNRDLKIKV